MSDNGPQDQQQQMNGIVKPHAHDVLSGRGNFVNHHSGNENFRALVKRHKKAYVACPKSQKPNYSKLIYQEIRSMNPPGRFLKQDQKTKLWNDIGEKKALDKTRQALREGAPELMKELEADGGEDDDFGAPVVAPLRQQRFNNALANSLMSVGSFSLGEHTFAEQGSSSSPFPDNSGNFSMQSQQMPNNQQQGNDAFQGHGAEAILAAAAQLQANQGGGLSDAQIQLLRNNLQLASFQDNGTPFGGGLANNNQFGGGNFNMNMGNMGNMGNNQNFGMGNNQNFGMGNNQNFGMGHNQSFGMGNNQNFNMGNNQNLNMGNTPNFNELTALLAAAQANNVPLGNEVTAAFLAAAHQTASQNGSSNMNRGGGNEELFLQIAQRLAAQNHSNNNANLNFNGNNFMNNSSNMGAFNSFGNMNNQHTNSNSGFGDNGFTISVPKNEESRNPERKDDIITTTTVPLKAESSNYNPSASRRTNSRGLNNSLKKSLTRRQQRQMNLDVANSLMSIESLCIDDIDESAKEAGNPLNMSLSLPGSEFGDSGLSNVFEEPGKVRKRNDDPNLRGKRSSMGHGSVHGKSPYDFSEISDLGVEDGAKDTL